MNDWTFTEHAKERIAERYHITSDSEIQAICRMLNNRNIKLIKDFNNDRQIEDITYKQMEIQLVTMPKIKQVISVIPKTFMDSTNIKLLKKQLNKFMQEEINISAHIANEVKKRMKEQEKKTQKIIDYLYDIILRYEKEQGQ